MHLSPHSNAPPTPIRINSRMVDAPSRLTSATNHSFKSNNGRSSFAARFGFCQLASHIAERSPTLSAHGGVIGDNAQQHLANAIVPNASCAPITQIVLNCKKSEVVHAETSICWTIEDGSLRIDRSDRDRDHLDCGGGSGSAAYSGWGQTRRDRNTIARFPAPRRSSPVATTSHHPSAGSLTATPPIVCWA